MKILVINGSPKGENSLTLQTCRYLMKRYPAHDWRVLHIGPSAKKWETDFTPAAEAIGEAELILFAYPVYTFLAPSQLHRFIALMKENRVDCRGKIASQITTSKHFYDVTAHAYIRDNVFDLGMRYVKGLSADMEDLLKAQGQKDAESFFEYLLYSAEHGLFETPPASAAAPKHRPVTVPAGAAAEKPGDTVIVADLAAEDTQLAAMIDRFRAVYPRSTRVVNLREFPFRGGCISCFRCAADGKCVYADGFDSFLREKIQSGEAIVLAYTVKDHSMGTLFKTYDDRQFCNGHRTVTMGMPFGYLVSGDLSAEENLRTVMEARAEVGGNFLAGVACDERDPDGEIDTMAARLAYAVEHRYVQPANYLGVGGRKIFRDLIWLMQGLMQADHKFFKEHGQYDFPQKQRGTLIKMKLVGALMNNPKIMAKAGGKVNEGMLGPYQKVLDAVEPKE